MGRLYIPPLYQFENYSKLIKNKNNPNAIKIMLAKWNLTSVCKGHFANTNADARLSFNRLFTAK